jgi:hypothetical protein
VSRAELEAKAARLRQRNSPALSTSVPTDLSTSVPTELRSHAGTEVRTALPPRVKTVRLTVDVPPADHVALRRLCIDLAAELGAAQISGQDVLRSLIRRVLIDEDAHRQLAHDLGGRQ